MRSYRSFDAEMKKTFGLGRSLPGSVPEAAKIVQKWFETDRHERRLLWAGHWLRVDSPTLSMLGYTDYLGGAGVISS